MSQIIIRFFFIVDIFFTHAKIRTNFLKKVNTFLNTNFY